LLILVGVGVTLVVVLGNGGSEARPIAPSAPARASASATAPASPTTPASDATVTAGAMAQVLRRYVDAYSAEDVNTLGSLFAPDLERVNGTDAPQDRSQALATYAGQFSQLDNPQYTLAGVTYDKGVTTGDATGRYRITSASGIHTGAIAFGFSASDGDLLIDRIIIEPWS
jgi:hypothetical protein